jgi:uncharacterized repeat protein (TIGR03803 family)
MKTHIRNLSLLPVLIAGLGLILAGQVAAQTFTTLYSFSNSASDGVSPNAVILSGNTLYGTAQDGGSGGVGTVFKLNTDGTGFTILHNFAWSPTDGAMPAAGLILSGNTLYGTAQYGGIAGSKNDGSGTVFKINTDGMGFTNVHRFAEPSGSGGIEGNGINSDGAYPAAGLILSGNILYGTTPFCGTNGSGTVFAVNTNGTGFTTLYSFTATVGGVAAAGTYGTNSDGASPNAVILSGNTLYGTAQNGGSGGSGTVFKLNTDGTGFTNLHSFTALDPYYNTNSDGAGPNAVILLGNTLYGTALGGGLYDDGTVFAINTDGSGFSNLHILNGNYGGNYGFNPAFNPDGLLLSGNTLYGTARGGTNGNGTLFAVNTNGTGFTNMYNFTGGSDGGLPTAGLILSGNTLYGTTQAGGGTNAAGTVFSLTLGSASPPRPKLTTIHSGAKVILAWPTNSTGFSLQSTTNLLPAAWSTVSPAPVVVNTNNVVTNTISGTQRFYRLSQ